MQRRFLLVDAAGRPTSGLVGLSGRDPLEVGPDGRIELKGLSPLNLEELERYAATAGHPVTESEPEGVS